MAPNEPSSPSRDPLFDLLRVVAILAVIGIHVLAPYMRELKDSGADRGLLGLFDQTLFVAVPLFLFVSGALVWSKTAPMGRRAYVEFIKRRALVVGLPYVAWTVFYLVLAASMGATVPATGVGRVADYAVAFVNGTAFYHLYFIPVLFVFYALTPVAVAIGRRSPEALLVAAVVIRALLGPGIVDLVEAAGPLSQLRPLIEVAVVRMPYMALGAWFAYRRAILDPVLKVAWPLILAAGLATFPTQMYGVVRPVSLELLRVAEVAAISALILGLAGLARTVVGRYAGFDAGVHALAGTAFGVYLAHPFVLWFLRQNLGAVSAGSQWLSPLAVASVTFALTAALSMLLVAMLKKSGPMARLV